MSVPNQNPIGGATGNGVTTAFPFAYYVADEEDLVVLLEGVEQTLSVDYTVAGVGNVSGGTITMMVAPANGARLVHYRATQIQRDTDYQENGDLLASVVNLDFDRIWLAIQDLLSGGTNPGNVLRVPTGEVVTQFPKASDRAGKFAVFDGSGNPQVIDLPTGAPITNASAVMYVPSGAGAVPRTVEARLRDRPSVFDFFTPAQIADVMAGTALVDVRAAVQAALDAGLGPIDFPPGVYGVTGELVVPDGSGIIGTNAFWKYRTGFIYSASRHTVFKYIGAGGANSAVIRASNKAVGVQGTDFNPAGDGVTDDLTNIQLHDFHVDCSNLAEIGVYVYRAGYNSNIGNITAEKAKKYNHVHLGCYAARFGNFGAFQSEEHGVAVGWDIFGWGSVEATCFNYTAAFRLMYNGTAGTYVAGTGTDLDGSGGRFSVGRGSKVFIDSEINDGRACLLSQYNIASGAGGPTSYILDYIEGNGDGAYIDYRDGMDGIRVTSGFIHPGNGGSLLPQNFKIDGKNNSGVTTANSGPAAQGEWLIFDSLFGNLSGTGFAIDSNTYKFRVFNSDAGITYPNAKPVNTGVIATGFFLADATLSDTRFIRGNVSLSRTAAGRYTLTFDQTQPNAEYVVNVTALQTTVGAIAYTAEKSTSLCEIRTVAIGAPATPADTGAFIEFSICRMSAS